ncbi:helix-turn-helix transcriptional regulator [Algoriphagus sp. A40]|uniref:ArsR/SmtB family transcription factor n=1 Tax=Algoriphagus sp. A40 TaxID=1945863 RepID=UPI0009844945|nr:metalloregulator ArsR/SmtB family transcription factor [Algoriphagus sp. A40]OOG72811.1 transcriptional regulator [Algoriphagus sp. A40]
MGITKTDLFTAEQNELAQLAKAFAHPARIAILQYLVKSKSCINGTLVQELGLAQATISQHLRELKDLGLIKGSIEGASISYCINSQKWDQVQGLFNGLFDQVNNSCSSDSCC